MYSLKQTLVTFKNFQCEWLIICLIQFKNHENMPCQTRIHKYLLETFQTLDIKEMLILSLKLLSIYNMHNCLLSFLIFFYHNRLISICFFFLRFYLFIHDRRREREIGRDTGRGRSRLRAGSPPWDSIPSLQDHTPWLKAALTPGLPGLP